MILLAAGNSRRFGSNKLLTEYDGKLLYQYTFDIVAEVSQWLTNNKVDYSIYTVSQYKEILIQAEKNNYAAIENHKPEQGIAYSIKLGIESHSDFTQNTAALTIHKREKYLFFVCDQPLLRSESVIDLISVYLDSNKSMGCLSYKNRMGNPCIFDDECIPDLLKLKGDKGGKKIILQNQSNTLIVQVDDEKELFDVDDIADFKKLHEFGRKNSPTK